MLTGLKWNVNVALLILIVNREKGKLLTVFRCRKLIELKVVVNQTGSKLQNILSIKFMDLFYKLKLNWRKRWKNAYNVMSLLHIIYMAVNWV